MKLFLLSALIHQLLAAYGWFYRYEAYLVTFGLVAIAAAAHNIFRTLARRGWIAAAVFLLATPLLVRGVKSFADTPSAMADIYHQQIQMANFFRTYYPGGRIALNDIGAVSFYADPYLTDVYGLGSTEVTRIRRDHHSAGSYTSTALLPAVQKDLFRRIQQNNVEVAAVYDRWFGFKDGDTPPGWIKVGTWTVPETTVLGSQTVSFYGVGTENAARLKANLAQFHSSLPPEIQPFAAPWPNHYQLNH